MNLPPSAYRPRAKRLYCRVTDGTVKGWISEFGMRNIERKEEVAEMMDEIKQTNTDLKKETAETMDEIKKTNTELKKEVNKEMTEARVAWSKGMSKLAEVKARV